MVSRPIFEQMDGMAPASAVPAPRSSNLVFTSAGDRANVRQWLKGRRDFDLFVVYYGNRPESLRDQADHFVSRRGSKFQNLHHCYLAHADILSRYDSILVMDDDILIDSARINRLFEIRRELDLWVLQPAFRLIGKISWDITRVRPSSKLRYTNFVEMSCPLFRKDKLDAFMAVYDPDLVGYGTDWWFLHAMGAELEGRVAIVDGVTCVNPHDRTKGGMREIDRLQPEQRRRAVWEQIRAREGIVGRASQQVEYRRVPSTHLRGIAAASEYLADWTYISARRACGTFARTIARPAARARP